MTNLALSLVLQASLLGSAEQSYAAAYKDAADSGKPLVVLVGADWCPGCRAMKQSVMPQVEREGGLGKVAFALVNTDKQDSLANKLMQGNTIPQLIVYRKTPDGWKRQQLIGAQSVAATRQFIASATDKPVATVGQREKK